MIEIKITILFYSIPLHISALQNSRIVFVINVVKQVWCILPKDNAALTVAKQFIWHPLVFPA